MGIAPAALVAVPRPEGPRLFVAGALGSVGLDFDGNEVWSTPTPGLDVIARDLDGDGAFDPWLCDGTGVVALPWQGVATRVFDAPCTTLIESDGVVIDSSYVSRWPDDGTPGVDLGFAQTGTGWLAVAGTLGFASTGDVTVQRLSELGIDTVAAEGTISALGTREGVFAWTLAEGALLDEAGNRTELTANPGAFATGDVDGDGDADAVVLWPDAVAILRDDEVQFSAVPVGRPIVADLDEDGCGEVFWIEADTVVRQRVTDCGQDADLDGDGWTVGDGDCDDADANVHPEAKETCDGVDDDCDGVVDPTGEPAVPARIALFEGTSLLLSVAEDSCLGGGAIDWPRVDSDELFCKGRRDEWECHAHDDVVLTVDVPIEDADGNVVQTIPVEFTVVNRAPTVDTDVPADGCSSDGPFMSDTFDVAVWDVIDVHLHAFDVDADPLDVHFVGGPPGLKVDGEGHITWTVSGDDEGTWDATLVVVDDEGAQSSHTYTIRVLPPGCGMCTSVIFLFVPLGWRLRRGGPVLAGAHAVRLQGPRRR